MAPSREIEKLQRRWQENPLGLTFAPLAEAYRKEGMLPDALELLEMGLGQHPNYVPAHIVRGRCFVDGRADSAAETAFTRVLDLDPENVIALKGLAEIAERMGRYPEAASRLERLLDVDRSNDEARLQLDRVRAALPSTPAVVLEPDTVPEEPAFQPAVFEESVVEPPVAEALPGEVVEPTEEPLPRAEILETGADDVEVSRYEPIELSASGSNEYQQPSDAEALLAEAPSPQAPVAEAPVAEAPVAEAPSIDAEDHAAVAGVEADPELVVTETMAEVFLRQGHRALALAVYTQLAGRSPDDRRIREAIGQLEAELKPAAAASIPAFAAVLTGGTSVRSFFEHLLSTTRPRLPEAQLPHGLSLGAVFGDDAAAKPVAAAPESGPSYDEFYAEEPGHQADLEGGELNGDDRAAGDDLENFTGWLKGLRR